ncbi:helix-turn-helix transcriptional regulator [Streptomyces sp. NPDC005373]|uniref:helix-turn-helix domain-containing protein n=1 Tax=unclassified Streptomyces TaxID=2593676 RepID=UPI0033BEA28F
MPPRTQRWRDLPPEYAEGRCSFATALREIKDCTLLTQAEVAKRAEMSTSTLNGFLNGRNEPRPEQLGAIYDVVLQDTRLLGTTPPLTRDDVFRLLAHWRPDPLPRPKVVAQRPAADIAKRRFYRERARRRRRLSSGVAVHAEVPVPQREGDRHLRANTSDTWTDLGALTRHLNEQRRQDAFFMLWQSATTLPAHAIPGVVASCRAAGFTEEADTVIANAARRDTRAVLRIAASFHAQEQYEDATMLLNAATPHAY